LGFLLAQDASGVMFRGDSCPKPVEEAVAQQTVVQLMDFIPNGWRSMEQLLLGLASRMRSEGWRTVHVFTGEPGPRVREALTELDSPYLLVNYPITSDDARLLAQQLQAYQPRLIQTHFLSMFNPVLRGIKSGCGASRLVVTDHSSGLASRKSLPKEALAWLRGRWVSSYIDQVIGVSDFVCQRDVHDVHFPAGKVRCIHNGVDTRRFVPATLTRPEGPLTLGFIGHLIPQKGLSTLLKAVANLRDQGRDFTLLVAGEGPQAAAFHQEVQALDLGDRVTFLGQISDTVGFYHQVDVLVVPSEWEEAFGFVVAEAAACGTCVVTSDVGGMPEIVGRQGEAGVVFPRAQVGALTTALAELMDDPQRRLALGRLGRARMEKQFSLDVTVDAYARSLLALLN
jgi:glycosyltransferase involved in cell wall biosynthesis